MCDRRYPVPVTLESSCRDLESAALYIGVAIYAFGLY